MAIPNKNKKDNNKSDKLNPRSSFSWFWLFLLALILGQAFFYYFGNQAETISWTEFKREMLTDKAVSKIVVVNKETAEVYIKEERLGSGNYAEFEESDRGPQYIFNIGSIETFEQSLEETQTNVPANERIEIEYVQRTDWIGGALSWILPLLIIIAIWMLILRRVRPGGNVGGSNIFDFGKSKAQLFEKDESNVTFEQVAGLEEVKVEVREIVDFLKNPVRYTRLGAKIPKGVLLIGPPGTGKTLLAKAVAGEAGVPFYSMSGSEFVEMFVGVGASRVRDLFKKAKQNSPSIIFIDEIDAIGRSRGKTMSLQGNDERENTLNQMLAEMDGFGTNTGVIVLAATNRGEILDRALLRPGRFDRQIYLELPTLMERKAIFEVHAKPLRLADDIDLETISAQTPGFSGADIANICNEAALIAARRNKDSVEMIDFYDASERVIAGMEKKNKIISDKEKKTIAYHEAGHATASWYLKHADPLLKVSIVPRGRSLGAAWYLPKENVIYTKAQLVDKICATLAGRASEEIVFNEISSGALDDLEKITKQAYTMVAYYGLSNEIRNLSYYDSTGQQDRTFQKPYSENTAQKIDKEVQELVDVAYERTKKLLIEHREKLDELANLLLSQEVVYKKELEKIFGVRNVEVESE